MRIMTTDTKVLAKGPRRRGENIPVPDNLIGGIQKPAHPMANVHPRDLKEILSTRLTSISIGAFMYLVMDEGHYIYGSGIVASDIIDWVRIILFTLVAFSLGSLGQILWDLLSLLLEMIVSWIPFGKASTGFKVYTNLYGALQGCSALYGYLLSKQGGALWKDLEEKSDCLIRWRGPTHNGKPCENQILSITLELEKSICEGSGVACSKLIFFGPFLIIGGAITLLGAVVAAEYLISNDFELPHCGKSLSEETEDECEEKDRKITKATAI